MSTERNDSAERPPRDEPKTLVPDETVVPQGSGKQFAKDVSDIHEVHDPKVPEEGKGFAQGQAGGDAPLRDEEQDKEHDEDR